MLYNACQKGVITLKVNKKEFLDDYMNLHMDDMRSKYGGVARNTILNLVKKYNPDLLKLRGRQQKIQIIEED